MNDIDSRTNRLIEWATYEMTGGNPNAVPLADILCVANFVQRRRATGWGKDKFLAEFRELCVRYQVQIDDFLDTNSCRSVELVHRPSNAEDWWSIEVDEKLLD